MIFELMGSKPNIELMREGEIVDMHVWVMLEKVPHRIINIVYSS